MSDYSDYIKSRPLSWWRAYMKGAYGVFEQGAGHPITAEEKRRLWRRVRNNMNDMGAVGSYTALAIMERVFGTYKPKVRRKS